MCFSGLFAGRRRWAFWLSAALALVSAGVRGEDHPGIEVEPGIMLAAEDRRGGDLGGGGEAVVEPEFNLEITVRPELPLEAFLSLQVTRFQFLERPPESDNSKSLLNIVEAYVEFQDIWRDGLSLRAGRQLFEDRRHWLFDAELDALRLFHRRDPFELELSVGRRELLAMDVLNGRPGERITNWLALGRLAPDDAPALHAYAFWRDDRGAANQDLLLVGLGSAGDLRPDLAHWLELAGAANRGGAGGLSGIGLDMGLTYRLAALPGRPSLTAGFAFASGDGDGGGERFRQSGLQANKAAFDGVAEFSYLGVALDPELSNLLVLTAGAGIRPRPNLSLDLVYHYYRQHVAASEAPENAIRVEPSGTARELGHGIDLVLGWEIAENAGFEMVGGVFLPGAAYPGARANGYFIGIELDYRF